MWSQREHVGTLARHQAQAQLKAQREGFLAPQPAQAVKLVGGVQVFTVSDVGRMDVRETGR